MTEWIVREPDETLSSFDERLSVWLMKHPTWAAVFDREILKDSEHFPTNEHTRWWTVAGWAYVRESAYLAIYRKYGGELK